MEISAGKRRVTVDGCEVSCRGVEYILQLIVVMVHNCVNIIKVLNCKI